MKLSDLKKLAGAFQGAIAPEMMHEVYAYMRKLGYDPGNIYQELEMDSDYVATHRDTSYADSYVSLHSHVFYEILFCRNVSGVEYLIGSNRYLLKQGDIVIVPPGISHRPIFPSNMNEPYKRDVIWLSTGFFTLLNNMVSNEMYQPKPQTLILRTQGTKWEAWGKYFQTGIEEAEKKASGWELSILGNTIQLMAQLYRAMSDDNAVPLKAEKPEITDQIMAYVERHLSEKITLSEVARRFYISESTIVQSFRKKMGVSFYRCVTQQRLIAAKNLILNGLSLEDISRQVGFTDYSTFYRAFKQEFGISPRQYKSIQSL